VSLNGSDLNVTKRNDFRISDLPSSTFTIVYNVLVRTTSNFYWGFSFRESDGGWTAFNHQSDNARIGYFPSSAEVNSTGVTSTPTYNRNHIDISYNVGERYQFGIVKTSDKMYFYVDNVLITQFNNTNILNRFYMNTAKGNTAGSIDLAFENIKIYDTVLDMENYVDPGSPIIYYVSVSNEMFLFDDVSFQPNLTFISGKTYSFDLSHNSNAGNTFVLGTVPDSSTNLIDYQTIVGTPGQPGAYTTFTASGETVYYYSFETPDMGMAIIAEDIETDLYTHFTFDNISGTTLNNETSNGNATLKNITQSSTVTKKGTHSIYAILTNANIASGIYGSFLPSSMYSSDFTLCFWHNITATYSLSVLIRDLTRNYIIAISNDKLQYHKGSWVELSGLLSHNTWYHIAICHNDTANTLAFYIDGVLQSTLTNGQFDTGARSSNFSLCGTKNGSGFSDGMVGYMDDFRFYTRILTENQLLYLVGS
jgi:hypothetical protein